MALRKAEQYVEDLRKQRREVYIHGEKVQGDWTEHPLIKPVINTNKLAYELAQEDEFRDLATTESSLIGERISRFVQLQTSPDDLIKRALLNRELQLRHGTCHAARCGGAHAINGLYATTYDMDKKIGTDYHKRFTKWLEDIQRRDLAVTLNSCDVKGDRSQRPSKQVDPDMYLHIVERRGDGIVIRGAKAHQSCPVVADVYCVVPYSPARSGEEDYAVACAVPADSEGIIHIYEWPAPDVGRLEQGADIDLGVPDYGVHGASLIIFDNVFVPYENVFMAGETEFALELITVFSKFQRTGATLCKSAAVELMAGAAASIAEYNGLDWARTPAIREKIIEMVTMAARCRGCALGACTIAQKHPSGIFVADELITNAAKLCHVDAISDATTLLIDIAGGLVATLPSERDLRAPATMKYMEKYFQGAPAVSVENRMRMVRLCEYLSGGSSTIRGASVHTGGSPEVAKFLIRAAANIDELKSFAKKLAKIQDKG